MIKLADGSTLDPKAKKVVKLDGTPADPPPSYQMPVPAPREGIKLEDLPADPKRMNVVCSVIGYKLLGLSDNDISHALGCTLLQLNSILDSDVYNTSYDQVIEGFVRGQEKTARDILARSSLDAAKVLTELATRSRDEKVKLKAADSVLNRMNITGDEKHGVMAQGLRIKIVRDTNGGEEINVKIGV